MTRQEKHIAMQKWIASFGAECAPEVQPGDLSEALYAISELGLWPDNVDSVSRLQALTCWQLVERLRKERLPDALKM